MTWRVRLRDVDFFLRDLWKDLRPIPHQAAAGTFAKDCFKHSEALREAAVLLILGDRIDRSGFPIPYSVHDSVLFMERVQGVRLYDLLRHLRKLGDDRQDGGAENAAKILVARARKRLRAVQLELLALRGVLSEGSYPLEQKLHDLLSLFVRIMDLRAPPRDWERNLEAFVDYWDDECVSVPFRDATTKNMLIADPNLGLPPNADDIDGAQQAAVATVLDQQPASYWDSVRLVDIDFSSIAHTTSPEDDPISLHCHECTFASCMSEPEFFVLDPMLGAPDAYRCAASFFVRYLRFGGRKLAYKLINAQGFKVRFAYDDPLFYFVRLPGICRKMSPAFAEQYAPLLQLVEQIAERGRHPSASDMALMSVDHLRKYYPAKDYSYWQQNPLEIAVSGSVEGTVLIPESGAREQL
jgi:hypothetical protein